MKLPKRMIKERRKTGPISYVPVCPQNWRSVPVCSPMSLDTALLPGPLWGVA